MSTKGKIVAGCLAPHPPHLVYGENPPQNEPKSECGWESLRWAYERLRKSLSNIDYDVLLVQSPHWRTQIATHFLGCEHFESKSVDPIFPHLFRFNYKMDVDVKLAQSIHDKAKAKGMLTKMMKNPDFRIDYGTITSLHLTNPKWDKPVVGISSVGRAAYFSMDVMQEEMIKLGEATREAIEESGKKCVLLASHSLSHRHFINEPDVPEDMSAEHIYHHGQYLWDMKVIEMMKKGQTQALFDVMTDFTEQTISECDGGGLMWMLSAMGMPTTPAEIHGYGTVIGTGNVVAEWRAQ